MKRILLLLMACALFIYTNAQNSISPCCNVISKNIKTNKVVIRDQTTGRLFTFQPNTADMNVIVVGDAVNTDMLLGKITAIRGSARDYKIAEPDRKDPSDILASLQIDHSDPVNGIVNVNFDRSEPVNGNVYRSKALNSEPVNTVVSNKVNPIEPCCSVVDIQVDPLEPCCSIVSFKNASGAVSYFKAPKEITNTLKVGQPVYSEPVNTIRVSNSEQNDIQPCCNVVSVQPDPAQPCCNIVTYKNNSTGALFQFRANKNISTVKVGEPLYAEPVNGFAIVQSSYGSSNGGMNSYGYGATSSGNSSGNNSSSEKWVISPVANMKGALGKLNINYPPDVDRDIEIYQPVDKKFITSVSKNDKQYTMAPGTYRFLITNVPVDDVPIQKGHETRLKIGFLNIVSEGVWDLHTEANDKQYTSGNRPRRIALPIGNYQLRLGTQLFPVTIKDKETVEL
jgi:hypothetical protein